jgi:phosphoribosyl-dephospho-CoA transferase
MASHFKPAERPVRRHDLAFVTASGWRAALAKRGQLAADPLITRWVDNGWPLIGRRAMPGETHGVALGLPLPPSAGKRRLAFLVEPGEIVSIARPPSLNAARQAAPRAWSPTLDRLETLALQYALEARVFGSLAWAALTGLDYLTDRSDLDLLLHVDRDTDLVELVTHVAGIEDAAPMRLDGELVRDDDDAVNWREIYTGAREIVVKRTGGIGVLEASRFISGGP